MRLAPNDKPGNQKNQWQKNRRGNSQPASELVSFDLGKAYDRRHMSRVSATEAIKRKDPCDNAAVNQNIGDGCHRWNGIEEEVLLFGQQGIARLRRGSGDDPVTAEKERLRCH